MESEAEEKRRQGVTRKHIQKTFLNGCRHFDEITGVGFRYNNMGGIPVPQVTR